MWRPYFRIQCIEIIQNFYDSWMTYLSFLPGPAVFFVLVLIALWISYDVFSWVGTFEPNGRIYTYWPVTNYRGIQFACPMEKEGFQYYFLAKMGTLGVTALNNTNGLVHDFNIASALAMEILQSFTKPSIHWSTISLYACIRSISNNRTTIAF